MARTMFALAAAGLVALTAGCRMCAHPYDYCGPTFTAEGCQECMPNARACSILAPEGGPCCSSEIVPETLTPVRDAQMVDTSPGLAQPIETVATTEAQPQTTRQPRSLR